jgi:hypothetical protein
MATKAKKTDKARRRAPAAQNMCPFCTKPFNKDALIVEYRYWKDGAPSDPKLAHPHCLLRVSPMEHQERAQRRRM